MGAETDLTGFHMTYALPVEKLGRTRMSKGQSSRLPWECGGDKGDTGVCVCVCDNTVNGLACSEIS